jgi:hemerythrin-like domain-containing protein
VCAYGDDFHQAKEEGVLFPIFDAVCDAPQQAAVRHMVFGHGQDRALMTAMAGAIARANPVQFADMANDWRVSYATIFTKRITSSLKSSQTY